MAAATHKLEQSNRTGVEKRREDMEYLASVADHLTGRDRAIVLAYCKHGLPATLIAELSGHYASGVYATLRRLERKFASPEARMLLEGAPLLLAETRAILTDMFVGGMSAPDAAEKHGKPKTAVYKLAQEYREWVGRLSTMKRGGRMANL